MKVPAEIRQMWTDAYNLLVEIYKDDEALTKDAESFFGPLADRIQAEANAHHHSHASDLLLAVYDQAERLWKENHNAAP